jgi:hypothetical protein
MFLDSAHSGSNFLVAGLQSSILNDGGWEEESVLLDPMCRYFVRHELGFRPQRNAGAALDFIVKGRALDVADAIRHAVDNDAATYAVKKNDVIRLTKFDIFQREEIAIMLFRRSDPDSMPPVFENRKTKILRPADKGPDDAEAISAHLFIHLDKKDKPHPTYRAILEEVPGLGRTYIQTLLGDILRENRYSYIDARGEEKETWTITRLDGIPSQNLGAALNGGGVRYIELVRPPNVDGLDVAGLVASPEKMKLTVRATSKKGILAAINDVRQWAAGGNRWPRVRVRVEEGERSRMVDIAREADAADVLFVHSEPVNVDKPLAQCTDVYNKELIAHAKQIFAQDKHW